MTTTTTQFRAAILQALPAPPRDLITGDTMMVSDLMNAVRWEPGYSPERFRAALSSLVRNGLVEMDHREGTQLADRECCRVDRRPTKRTTTMRITSETRRIPTDNALRGPWAGADIYEDNAGGLYLHLRAHDDGATEDVVISGMEQSEDALTDCRTLGEWADTVAEEHRWHTSDLDLDSMTRVASYWPGGATHGGSDRPEGLTIHGPLGRAAERYLGVDGEWAEIR